MSESQLQELEQQFEEFRSDFQRLREEIGKVFVGQQEIVTATLTSLIAGGHVLLEGVPGLGKTLLVRTLASALQAQFSRIQFTPDLMPADMIGTNVLIESPDGSRSFQFQPGPLFANIVLADEINRATPKTQSALLEAMQEQSVTVGGETHPLSGLFFVLATQNPLEMEGTYPLPEAQLDRFFFKLLVDFPEPEEIELILDRTTESSTPQAQPIISAERIAELGRLARQVPIASEIRRYAIGLVMATHPDKDTAAPLVKRFVRYGSSPRGAQALIMAAKVHAVLDERFHVAREDLHSVALPCLRHRLILNFEAQADGILADEIILDLLSQSS